MENLERLNSAEDLEKENNENVVTNNNKSILFFSISIKRLVICSWLSCHMYLAYLIYKNWAVYKEQTNKQIMPVLRGLVFTIFFVYPLHLAVKKNAKNYREISGLVSLTTILYIIFNVILAFMSVIISLAEPWEYYTKSFLYLSFAILLFFVITPLWLIPLQKMINKNNQDVNPNNRPEKMFYLGELVAIVFGIIIFFIELN